MHTHQKNEWLFIEDVRSRKCKNCDLRLAAYVNTSSHRWQKRSHCLLTDCCIMPRVLPFNEKQTISAPAFKRRERDLIMMKRRWKEARSGHGVLILKGKEMGPVCVCVCVRVCLTVCHFCMRWAHLVFVFATSAIYSLVLPRLSLFFLF